MKPYERLSKLYDKDWGKYSSKYTDLISNVIETYNLNVHSILDVACGTGILASELYSRNFEVSGIDISEDMINVARKNTKGIDFQVADISDFTFDKRFQMITCAFDSINYLTCDVKMEKTLRNILLHLDDNGVFIFDINTPTLYEERHFGIIDRSFDEIKFKQILEYDKEHKIGKTIFDFDNNESETHIQKAYSVDEMDKFLLKSGFEIMNRYKDFKLSPIDDKAYKIFYVVKRQK
ncbi:class I SAM-dependent DNA methyltransferase [Clostridium tagluense]|uniref:class I SAM-dependent DNA methyltransferase n=1 Tax=Clostridium tagluense TaxID=360422 RepID=UPI001C6EC2C3|nr:class I SAM-dependent methyltransferase [Clostridium tagluense]MBW9159230.1 methyltransferase domain-containing protein [Clostridium tagluense]WLC68136.1 methyltransferase domain-containing protein [Clostridium tagluense]